MFYHFRLPKNPPLSHASLSVAILFDISQVVLFFYISKHMYISCLGTNSHRVKSTLIVPSIKISNSPGNFICATAGQNGAFE